MRTIVAAALLVSVIGCSGGSNSQPTSPTPGGSGSSQVAINGDAYLPNGTAAFSPDNLTIDRGATVTWRNNDQTTHTATSNGGFWNASIGAGGSTSQQFTTAGTFEYHCTIHPYMTGRIVVR